MARSVQASLIQGVLIGALIRADHPLFRAKVEQETDEEGVYLPHFTVTTFSGAKIRVTVEDVTE